MSIMQTMTVKKRPVVLGLAVVILGTFLALIATSVYAQETGGVAASGTASAKITISLSDTTMALGTPDPTCEGLGDGATTGEFTVYNGTTGNEGCAYAWDILQVRVKSNKAWTGTINGADGAPTSGVTVVNGSFRYDSSAAASTYTQCTLDTTLATTTASFEPSGLAGNNLYNFHHCVTVDWDDADGTIDSTSHTRCPSKLAWGG